MKRNAYRDYFKNNFVKPLYIKKKVLPNNKFAIATHNIIKLDGSDILVKRKLVSDNIKVNLKNENREDILIPERLVNKNANITNYNARSDLLDQAPRRSKNTANCIDCKMANDVKNKSNEDTEKIFDINTIPDVWLRVYPLTKQPQESLSSLIFRCVFCILGLYTVMILWTMIWVFTIYSFEGPYETQISAEFEEKQNQLVIDLATELRLITPLSPKWKDAIIKRIEDERQLTVRAVAKGAKLHPGEFWDLSGTFLFTVYVMTALGFGAPVPQTLWGRTSALLYALLAVPIHLYLKSPNCSRDSTILQDKYGSCFKRKVMGILNILCACSCMPVITISYYVCGALAFGWSRDKQPLEVVMFPLEFTTSGGLELVPGHVRVLYAIYLEGAIIFLACFLLVLKRKSYTAVYNMADKYKLFTNIHVK